VSLSSLTRWHGDSFVDRSVSRTCGVLLTSMTGATGFLGSFLLAELYRCMPNGQIICLLRKKSERQQMIGATMRKYEIDSNIVREIETSTRITWLEGDLNLSYFGLSEEQFFELAAQTDHVIHNAAWVNGMRDTCHASD